MDGRVDLRVSLEVLESWRKAAAVEGVSLSGWVRGACNARLERQAEALAKLEVAVSSGLDKGPVGWRLTEFEAVTPKGKKSGCSQAHFHRSGTFCKSCGFGG